MRLVSPEDPGRRRRQLDDEAGLLYDFAVDHPRGFIYEDAKDKFGWHYSRFIKVVRHLRQILSADEITLTATPQGQHERWLYMLVGTYDAARPWATNRVGDLETRLDTIHGVANTLTNATDGRSVEGKKARLIERTIRHLMENLNDLAAT